MWFEVGHREKCTSEHSQHAVNFFSVNNDSLPEVGEELPTNGQHTPNNTNRLQFE